MQEQADVVVVGAGISGLVAARDLVRAGRSVVVLEARERVGGRTCSIEAGGHRVDVGGQWIGPGQDRIAALARELGVTSFAQNTRGKKVMDVAGKTTTYRGLIPKVSLWALLETELCMRRIDRLMKKVPLDAPWDAADAVAWDAVDVDTFVRERVRTTEARALVHLATQAIFAVEARELSLLWFLFYLRSGGGLRRLASVENGAQERRFVGGAMTISERIAAELGPRVRLSTPVARIVQRDDGVSVEHAGGRVACDRVILAIPPALCGKIELSPALPDARARLHEKMPMGKAVKCIVGYERAFWRDAGFCGEVVADHGDVRLVFDECQEDGKHPALLVFLVGDVAQELGALDEPARRARIVDGLARYFGAKARDVAWYVEKDWTRDPWSSGCYAGNFAPRAMKELGSSLRAPIGRLHFAGTETALKNAGYMDGAVEAGARAAAEVDDALGDPRGRPRDDQGAAAAPHIAPPARAGGGEILDAV